MNKFNIKVLLPLFLMMALAVGIYVGSVMNIGGSSIRLFSIKYTERDKMHDVINYIANDYVDSVNSKILTEKTISALLNTLDPHSSYIPPRNLKEVEESMMGNFFGIGVQFRQWHDSVVVVRVISGGPSQQGGVYAGDRLISADNISLIGLNNDSIMKLLKGPMGTHVNVKILRPRPRKTFDVDIIRGEIPYKSVISQYVIDDSIAYIKIDRFAATTYFEFKEALIDMGLENIKKVIVDLQNNGGGLLSSTIALTDEFLPAGKIIVYTKGRKREKEISYSTENQLLKGKKVVVLVNESSASASEIFSGAIQDNDRGLIIGRRTFGKGLVQEQITLADNSAIRLTVARYYTATGRCIQKPYGSSLNNYYHEVEDRYNSGEMYNADSASFPDSLKYTTALGKTVYGGGGIWPDIFVPVDTTLNFWFYNQLQNMGIISDFTFAYFDKNRQKIMKAYPTEDDFVNGFVVSNQIMNKLFIKAQEAHVIMPKKKNKKIMDEIKLTIKAQIASDIYGYNAYFKVMNPNNEIYIKALSI